jgi:hypothetical protein
VARIIIIIIIQTTTTTTKRLVVAKKSSWHANACVKSNVAIPKLAYAMELHAARNGRSNERQESHRDFAVVSQQLRQVAAAGYSFNLKALLGRQASKQSRLECTAEKVTGDKRMVPRGET